MADELIRNGDFSDDHTLGIIGDDDSSETSGLSKTIVDLEEEINREIEEYKSTIEELKASVENLTDEKTEMKKQFETAESEKKMLQTDATGAADEASRPLKTSNLPEKTAETFSELKTVREKMKGGDYGKYVKLDALPEAKDLSEAIIDTFEELENVLSAGFEVMEKRLLANIKDLGATGRSGSKNFEFEKLMIDLDAATEKMTEEKEKAVRLGKERVNSNNVMNEDATEAEKRKESVIDGLKRKDWVVFGVGILASVVVLGTACYVRSAMKH